MAKSENIDWEKRDEDRIFAAVRELRKSENLRFFLRHLCGVTGLGNTPDGSNALEAAKMIGRHQVGVELTALLTEHDAALYPDLLLEENKEQIERGTNVY